MSKHDIKKKNCITIIIVLSSSSSCARRRFLVPFYKHVHLLFFLCFAVFMIHNCFLLSIELQITVLVNVCNNQQLETSFTYNRTKLSLMLLNFSNINNCFDMKGTFFKDWFVVPSSKLQTDCLIMALRLNWPQRSVPFTKTFIGKTFKIFASETVRPSVQIFGV